MLPKNVDNTFEICYNMTTKTKKELKMEGIELTKEVLKNLTKNEYYTKDNFVRMWGRLLRPYRTAV